MSSAIQAYLRFNTGGRYLEFLSEEVMQRAARASLFALSYVCKYGLPLAIIFYWMPVGAQESESAPREVQNQDAASAALQRMRRRALSLTMYTDRDRRDKSATLQDKPLLRYSDAGGITTDATIWAWGNTGRPLAVCAIFYERKSPREEKWSCELTALAEGRYIVEGEAGWQWSPEKSDVDFQPMPGAPPPSETARLRRTQMNEIVERFVVSETFNPERTDQLRLMPRSLYRYSDTERGLIDGALYAFANGTNPEALLILECRSVAKAAPTWQYGFARLSAAQLQAKLDDAVVWRRAGVVRWNPHEPYYSRFGPDGEVFPRMIDLKSSQ